MLTLICGLPRAGKTTFSKQYENVVHLDEVGFNYERCNRLVRDEDIVIEGVYNKAEQRKALLATYHGGAKKCIWLDTPKHIRQERAKTKIPDMPFEPPTYSEGWDEIIVIGETNGTNN